MWAPSSKAVCGDARAPVCGVVRLRRHVPPRPRPFEGVDGGEDGVQGPAALFMCLRGYAAFALPAMPLTRSSAKRPRACLSSPRGQPPPPARLSKPGPKLEPTLEPKLEPKLEELKPTKLPRTKREAGPLGPSDAKPAKRRAKKAAASPTAWHRAVAPDIEDAAELAVRARAVHEALTATGLVREAPAADAPRRTVLEALFATILSQATTKINSTRAFDALMSRFAVGAEARVGAGAGAGTGWAARAHAAGAGEIEDAIRCAGLANRKAARMWDILDRVFLERQQFCLEHVRTLADDAAIAELTKFKGVGPKTASCVLMFNMNRDEMPVDTHVNRIARRLGWTNDDQSPEATYDLLNACVDGRIKYALHCQLVDHGRQTCKAQKPQCHRCPIASLCASASFEHSEDSDQMDSSEAE